MATRTARPAYEAVWDANGRQHEIAVAKDGMVLGLEEIITLAEAPEAIRAVIEKEAGKNKVLEVAHGRLGSGDGSGDIS